MRGAISFLAAFVFVAFCVPGHLYADGAAGNWKWDVTIAGADPIKMTAVFKVEKDKLTGTFLDGYDQQKFDIKDGKIDKDKVSFTITRPIGDQSITVNYSGKLDGDTITGTMEFKFGDQDPMKMDWKAERAKDAATQPATQP